MFTSSPSPSTTDLQSAIVRDPLVVSMDATVMEAIALMSGVRSQCEIQGTEEAPLQNFYQSVRTSCVLVVESNQVIGILTERDIVRLSAQQQPLDYLRVRQVMVHPVMTLRESAFTDLFGAINLLQQSRIRHLPILDGQDHLVGLVTYESLRHISRPIDLLRLRSVTEVMTQNVVCATPDTPILAIAQQMTEHRISSVVIVQVDQDVRRPLGILTERDLVQFQALGLDLQTCQAGSVMSAPVFSVPPGESLWAVQQLMEQRLIHRLVVTGDRGDLLGIITQTSILQALNPIELYKLATVLESRISHLEAEKLSLLSTRANELEQQVAARTAALKLKAAREKLVAQIANRIRNSLDLQAILDTCVSEVLAFLECDRVLVYQFAPDWSGNVIAEAVQPGFISALGNQINDSCFQQQATLLFATEQPIVVNNIYESGYNPCHIKLLERYQVKANLVVPIWVTGKLWGLLIGHQCADQRNWQEEDLGLLQDIAVQLAIALQQATTHQQLQAELQARQQAEIHLRQSEQRYATLVAAAPVGIYRTDAAGNCIYVNDRYCQITGLTLETSLGQNWQQGLYPEDRTRLVAEWQEFVQHRHSFRLEYRFRHPDGTVKWVYGQAIAERNDQGQVVGYVGTITDISDRKRSEEALQKSEAHQRALMSALPDLIMRVHRDGYYLECVTTPTFQVVGLPTLVGATIMNTLPPDVAQSRLTYMHLALETQRLQIYEQDFWWDGRRYLEEVRVVPYNQDEVLLLVRDISDRKQAEMALKQSEAKSRALLSAIPDLMLRVGADGVYRGYATHRCKSDVIPASIDPVGYRMTDLLPEWMATQHIHYLELALQTGELQVFEQQIDLGDRIQDEEVRVVKSADDEVLFMIRDITDRKRAEAQRLQAEKARLDLDLLEQILNVVLAGYWDWDIPSNYEYLSPGLKRMFGYEDHELANSPESWQNLIFPEDLPSTLERFTQHVQSRGQVPFYNEVRYRHKDGSTIWVVCSGKVIEWDEQGNPLRAIGCHIDITERRAAEEALRQRTEELDRFFSVSLDLLCIADTNGYFRRVNRQWEKILGYPISELEGSQFLDYVHPEDLESTLQAISALDQGQQLLNFVNRYRCRDGSYRWIEWRSFPSNHLIYAAARDITEQRQVEAAMKQQLAAIEAAIDGIAILQGETYRYVNQAHLEMFGYDRSEELIGQNWQVLFSQREMARFHQEVFPVLERDRSWEGEAIATRKDGSTFHEGLSLTLTDDGLLICVCRDISERKQAEAQLQQTNEELARATRLKDEFLANMSHELRTPLNAILGMTEGLQEQVFGPTTTRQQTALHTIERSGSHLLELINDILDVAKIESGQIELSCASTGVVSLCQSSLTFIKEQALKKQIQLETKLPANLPNLLVDERRIRQVLINLLNNAVKFTPEGGQITLEASCHRVTPGNDVQSDVGQHYLRIAIADTGIGIAPEHLPKLFQPFIQIDSALNRQYQGTGLGLALVKRIVELHGGQVGVTSQIGVGSCFTVDLPCSPVVLPLELVPSLPETPVEEHQSCPIHAPLILLAEDNEANISTVSSYLKAKGYRIVLAKNGEEAIAQAQLEQPDLILMDIQMPEVDGLEAIRRIRQNQEIKQVPIMALTALAMPGDRERCITAGANDYVSKPIKLKQLTLTIQRLLAVN